jgi:DNA-binding IclR family transcriptional regulator
MTSDTHTAQTLDRGLEIMEILAQTQTNLTIAEIAQKLAVHRTIAHRLLATLDRRDLVHRALDGRYRLGSGLMRLAGTINRDLREVARPFLVEINAQTDETVHLAVLARTDVLFIDSLESSKVLRVVSRTGRAYPAHATSAGKAMIASLSQRQVATLLHASRLQKVTSKTISSQQELAAQLALVRELGYATNSEEAEEGVASISVAIVDKHRDVQAALSVAAPVARFAPTAASRFVKLIQKAAWEIGDRI